MYKVTKPMGYNRIVTLTNEETHAEVKLGVQTTRMYGILGINREDYTDQEDYLEAIKGAWDMAITDEQARELSGFALRMTKPTRKKVQATTTTTEQKKKHSEIDAWDVLMGLAKYE